MHNLIYGECRDRIKRFEGVREWLYYDDRHKLTGGVGHNFTDNGIPGKMVKKWGSDWVFREMSVGRIEELFTYDLEIAFKDLCDIFNFDVFEEFPFNVQAVLMDMCFNMGKKSFLSFTKMRHYLFNNLINEAAKEIRNSKYWRDCEATRLILLSHNIKNVYGRAEENAKFMES